MAKKRVRMLFSERHINDGGKVYIELFNADVGIASNRVEQRMSGFMMPIDELPRAISLLQREFQKHSRQEAERALPVR